MKFLKKAGAILLAVSMLPAFSAFAETSQTYVDDFNGYTEDLAKTWWFYGSDTYPSDVFKNSNSYGVYIDADGGHDGTSAFKVNPPASGGNFSLATKTVNTSGATSPVLSLVYDFKILQDATDSTKVNYIGCKDSNNGKLFKIAMDESDSTWKFIDNQGVDDAYAYTLDNWYRLSMYSTADGTYGVIVDLTTNEVVITSANTSDGAKGLTSFTAVYMQNRSSGWCTMLVDNVVLQMYDAAVDAPELLSANIEDGEEVLRNRTFTFTFDQAIDENSTISLKKRGENGDIAVDSAVTSKVMYNTLSVTYDGLLDKGSEYVVSFENVTNGSTASSTSELTFTTENLHLWNDVVVSSAEPNVIDATKTDVTFTIGDEYGYPVFSGSVMAVVYQDGKMIEVDIKPLINVSTGELTESFALGTVPAGAKIGIILLDVENGPIPLAGGMLEN